MYLPVEICWLILEQGDLDIHVRKHYILPYLLAKTASETQEALQFLPAYERIAFYTILPYCAINSAFRAAAFKILPMKTLLAQPRQQYLRGETSRFTGVTTVSRRVVLQLCSDPIDMLNLEPNAFQTTDLAGVKWDIREASLDFNTYAQVEKRVSDCRRNWEPLLKSICRRNQRPRCGGIDILVGLPHANDLLEAQGRSAAESVARRVRLLKGANKGFEVRTRIFD